jgi:hypothetical protein
VRKSVRRKCQFSSEKDVMTVAGCEWVGSGLLPNLPWRSVVMLAHQPLGFRLFLGGWPGGPVPLSLLGLKCQISNTSFSLLNCKGNLSFSTLCASVNSDRSCRYRRVRMSWQQCKLHLAERDAGWELVRPPLSLFTRPRAPLTGRLSVDSSYRCRQPMLVPVSAPPLEKPTELGLGVL